MRAIAAVVLVLAPRLATAEPAAAADRNRAGVSAIAVVPVDDWSERTGAGGGAGIWLEVPISPRMVVTARTGVAIHAPATITAGARLSLIEVPVLGGARLELGRLGRVRVLFGGDVGLVVAHERVSLGGVTEGDTGLRFGADVLAGLAVDRVALELGPWLADLTDLDHSIGFQLSLSVRLRSW